MPIIGQLLMTYFKMNGSKLIHLAKLPNWKHRGIRLSLSLIREGSLKPRYWARYLLKRQKTIQYALMVVNKTRIISSRFKFLDLGLLHLGQEMHKLTILTRIQIMTSLIMECNSRT
jgi:hypothetical protein